MTSLALILIVAVLFAAILTYESGGAAIRLPQHPTGLLSWLTSGNWPAKVGAGLIIIGVGALLRYAFANIDVPPETKLGSGILGAAALGFGSFLLKGQPKRRAIHLALAGAAFGVAYLTAYSAYGFFNYITDVNALALLALVATFAGVFAVQSNVMSVAILAMVGAYIAPKFALGAPGVLPVYGYFLAASVLCLVMVALRGWRPLIHLSFLFTLAGALFFAWDGKFYEPEHYGLMQPLLLALTAVHLAMPLSERKFARSARFIRFDIAYSVILPTVSAALTLKIAPDIHAQGSIGLGALALLWGLAAGILQATRHPEAIRHALTAIVLATLAGLVHFEDPPLLLIGLGLSVVMLSIASRQDGFRRIEELSCGAAMTFGIMYILQTITGPQPTQGFLNGLFAYRLVAGALMITAARIGVRRNIGFAIALNAIGVLWVVMSFVAELARLHIDFLPQLIYGSLLVTMLAYARKGDRFFAPVLTIGLLMFFLVLFGWSVIATASDIEAVGFLVAIMVVPLVAIHPSSTAARKDRNDFAVSLVLGLLPLVVLPWAYRTAQIIGVETAFYPLTVAMVCVVIAGWAGYLWLEDSPRWNHRMHPIHAGIVAVGLLGITLFHIERGPWPIAFELLAIAFLVIYVSQRARVGIAMAAVTILLVALVLQAMLLRGFGPDGKVLTASDIYQMHLPAVVSLMWVIFGSGMAWWGTKNKDRTLWSLGAGLLVVAAVKLVFFDFGTLGQLGNIIAFIAAGMAFMGVAWFAPIPPKAERGANPDPNQETASNGLESIEPISPAKEGRLGWLWFLLLSVAAITAFSLSVQHKRYEVGSFHSKSNQTAVQRKPDDRGVAPLDANQTLKRQTQDSPPLVVSDFAQQSPTATKSDSNRTPLWIGISDPSSGVSLAVDYRSITLDGKNPVMTLRVELNNSVVIENNRYSKLIARYEADCSRNILLQPSSILFASRDETVQSTFDWSPNDRYASHQFQDGFPAGMMKSLCTLREHHFTVPNIELNDTWDQITSPTQASMVYEAPHARQMNDGILLVKYKNVFPAGAMLSGRQSPTGIVIAAFDCAKVESRLVAAIRYDPEGIPVLGTFHSEAPITPTLEANRKRLVDACNLKLSTSATIPNH